MSAAVKSSGLGLCGWLFLLFTYLKLTDAVDWSWWAVTAPLWIPVALILLLLCGIAALVGWKAALAALG